MAFAPTKPWKLPFITTWGGSPNRNLPTNSAEEAEQDQLLVNHVVDRQQVLVGTGDDGQFVGQKRHALVEQTLNLRHPLPVMKRFEQVPHGHLEVQAALH